MSTHTETEQGAWHRFVTALIGRCRGLAAELGREEMLLERQEFDQRLQRGAEKTEHGATIESQRT